MFDRTNGFMIKPPLQFDYPPNCANLCAVENPRHRLFAWASIADWFKSAMGASALIEAAPAISFGRVVVARASRRTWMEHRRFARERCDRPAMGYPMESAWNPLARQIGPSESSLSCLATVSQLRHFGLRTVAHISAADRVLRIVCDRADPLRMACAKPCSATAVPNGRDLPMRPLGSPPIFRCWRVAALKQFRRGSLQSGRASLMRSPPGQSAQRFANLWHGSRYMSCAGPQRSSAGKVRRWGAEQVARGKHRHGAKLPAMREKQSRAKQQAA